MKNKQLEESIMNQNNNQLLGNALNEMNNNSRNKSSDFNGSYVSKLPGGFLIVEEDGKSPKIIKEDKKDKIILIEE